MEVKNNGRTGKESRGATQAAPENTPKNEEKKAATNKAQAKKAEGAKVYNFTSKKKFLTCAGLGVQFMNGKASTDNLEVARALAKIDGVELVEG